MEKIKYSSLSFDELEKLAKDGDPKAALKVGEELRRKLKNFDNTDLDENDSEKSKTANDTNDYKTPEKWLLFAYENADSDKTASFAAMDLYTLYSLNPETSPVYNEEAARDWYEKYSLANAKTKIIDAFEFVNKSTALVRKAIYEQAEKKEPETFEKIGKSLLAWYDDVQTPDSWKAHGYGTPTDVKNMGDTFYELFEEMLKKFISRAIGEDERLHNAFNMLNLEERRHVEAKLVDEGQNEVREFITRSIFTFEDIKKIDDRSIQRILREVDSQELAKALKISSKGLFTKITRNMSKRAAMMLEEDIEFMGPVRKADVYEAQDKIRAVVQRLEDRGEIVLASFYGDDELVQ